MELNVGSNIIRNTSGILSVQGTDQISLEIGERDRQLLLTMDVYNHQGGHIAKLRRNAWVFNEENRYSVRTSPAALQLLDTRDDSILVEANVVSQNRIDVLNGLFYTHRGNLLEITPSFWRIDNSITMSGNIFEGGGGAVAID